MIKKLLHLSLITCFFVFPATRSSAQHVIDGNGTVDSAQFTFSGTDSLSHISSWSALIIDTSVTDPTATRLWEIGLSHKNFFGGVRGIMTDTVNEYPVNANSWFTLKLSGTWLVSPAANPIISFTHKYQTTAGLDGCIVEFSLDGGITWQNVQGQCNGDINMTAPAVLTDNFYSATDTLYTGEKGFSGTGSWTTSRFQFFSNVPLKTTGGGCNFGVQEIQIRFRFISDANAESLDGWLINDITVEQDYYAGSVGKLNKPSMLSIYPNPSADNIFNFPALDNEKNYNIEVVNAIGARVMDIPYTHQVNLSGYAKGLYFYRVTNGTEHYAGQLVSE